MPDDSEPSSVRLPRRTRPWTASSSGDRCSSSSERRNSASSASSSRDHGDVGQAAERDRVGREHRHRDVGAQAEGHQRARVVEVYEHVVAGQQRNPPGGGPAEHGRQRQPVGVRLPGERGGGVRLRRSSGGRPSGAGCPAAPRRGRRRAASRSGRGPGDRVPGRAARCSCRTWHAASRSPEPAARGGVAGVRDERGGHGRRPLPRHVRPRVTALTSPYLRPGPL